MKVLTKSEAIAEEIRRLISSETYRVGEALPSERKLAEKFSSSQVTINKAISCLVSEGLIDKRHGSGNYVMEAAQTKTICYMIEKKGDSKLLNPVWLSVYEAFHSAIQDYNVKVNTVFVSGKKNDISLGSESKVDLIVASLALNPERVENILKLGVPVVWLDQYEKELPGYSIYFDLEEGGYSAGEHLLEMNCRKILYLTFPMDVEQDGFEYYPSRLFFKGMKKALREAPDQNSSLHYYSCFYDRENFAGDMQNYLEGVNGVDAICCFADEFLPSVVRLALKSGRSIPDDLTVMGLGSDAFCGSFIPSLTSLSEPLEEMGEKCSRMVKDIFEGKNPPMKQFIKLTLTVRESTKRVPS